MRAARKVGPIRRAFAQILLGLARFFEWAARLIAPVDAVVDPAYLAVAKRYPGAPEHWLRDIAERMGNFAYAPVRDGTDIRHGGGAPESPRARAERIARSDRLMDDWFGAAEVDDRDELAPGEPPSRLPPQVRLRAVPQRVDAREQAFQAMVDDEPAARDVSASKTDVPARKPRVLRPRNLSSRDAAPQERQMPRREDAPRPAAADAREPTWAAVPPRVLTPRTSLRVRPDVFLEELPSPHDSRPRAQAVTVPHPRDDIRADKLAQISLEPHWRTTDRNASQRPAHATAHVQWRSPSSEERHEAYDPRYQPRSVPPDLMRPSAPPSKPVDPQRWHQENRTSYPHLAGETAIVSPPQIPWPGLSKSSRQTPVESRWPDLPQSAPLLSDVEEQQIPSVTARLESLRTEQERGEWSA